MQVALDRFAAIPESALVGPQRAALRARSSSPAATTPYPLGASATPSRWQKSLDRPEWGGDDDLQGIYDAL